MLNKNIEDISCSQFVSHCSASLIFDKIKNIFDNLDDKNDLFEDIKNEDINDVYICYREHSEYGDDIKICEKTGKLIYKLFISDMIDENKCRYITTFWNDIIKKGLFEKIYSNRTEHYIDGDYVSVNFPDEIMEIIKINTKMIMYDKKFPMLYNFIIKTSKDDITLIPKKEFD